MSIHNIPTIYVVIDYIVIRKLILELSPKVLSNI